MNVDILRRMKQPSGDDFFVVSFIVDDSDPCWDSRHSFMGSWQSVQNTLSLFHFPKNFSVLLLQGQNAKDYLLKGAREELRYQQQQHSQPNN